VSHALPYADILRLSGLISVNVADMYCNTGDVCVCTQCHTVTAEVTEVRGQRGHRGTTQV